MGVGLSEPHRRPALNAFVLAMAALDQAEEGNVGAVEEAITLLHACLEWVTPQTWPCLWVEAQIAKADAYVLRRQGDPLENARSAIACYRAALGVALDAQWQWAAEPLSSEDGSVCEDASEPRLCG
jgi:hypothetical protein